MKQLTIKQLQFLDNFLIDILLCNDVEIVYDLKPKLQTSRFLDIADEELFKNGKVVGDKLIRWNESTEISLSEIIMQIQKYSEYTNT